MSDFLNTVAVVAVTLTGFIGVVFVLGRRSEGGLCIHESSAIFHLLYTALGALFLSLVASVFLESTIERVFVSQVGNGICGLYLLLGVGMATAEALRGELGIPKKVVAWPILGTTYALIGVNFVVAAGYFPGAAPIVFMICIVWLLFVATITFIGLLPTERQNA